MRYSKPTNLLSERELYALDSELATHTVERYNTVFQENIKCIDLRAWLFSRGATNSRGSIIITNYTDAKYTEQWKVMEPMDCDPIKYETCMHEYEQWLEWKGKKEYGKKMQLEELDEKLSTPK